MKSSPAFAVTLFSSFTSLFCISSFANAQEAAPRQRETITEKGGPSRGMLFTGVATLGASYGAAAIVASTSSLAADRRMLVPFAGPWMALSDRGECGMGEAKTCSVVATEKAVIVADGVFQGLGGLLVIASFLNPETKTTTTYSRKPTFHIAPARVESGYGLSASGTFF